MRTSYRYLLPSERTKREELTKKATDNAKDLLKIWQENMARNVF